MGNVIDASKKMNNGGNTVNEELKQFQLSDGRWRVYVKPYTAEVKEELETHRTSKHAAKSITVTVKDGTYCITSKEIIRDFRDLRTTLWFMIFWRFRCEAKNTFATAIEGNTSRKLRWCENKMNMAYNNDNKENHFYVVSLSPQFIEATCLPQFYVPATA